MPVFVRNLSSGASTLVMTMGVCSIAFGLAVIAMPWLLIYLVGAFFLFVGLSLIGAALQMRRGNRAPSGGQAFDDFKQQIYRGEE